MTAWRLVREFSPLEPMDPPRVAHSASPNHGFGVNCSQSRRSAHLDAQGRKLTATESALCHSQSHLRLTGISSGGARLVPAKQLAMDQVLVHPTYCISIHNRLHFHRLPSGETKYACKVHLLVSPVRVLELRGSGRRLGSLARTSGQWHLA